MKRSITVAGAIALALTIFAATAAAFGAPMVDALLTDPGSIAGGLLLANVAAAVDPAAVMAEIKRIAGDIEGFKAGQKQKLADAVQQLGDVLAKQGEQDARLLDMQQKLARRGEEEPFVGVSSAVRAALEGNSSLKAMSDRRERRTVIDMPAGYFKQAWTVNAAVVSGNGLAVAEHMPELVEAARRRLTIRSLLPSVPTDAGAVNYTRETGFTNAAAPVSEGDTKPESSVTFELKTTPIITIAHWIKTSLQVLADTPQLELFINTILRYGVAYQEELQILKGSGVGNNLEGLYTAASAYSAPIALNGSVTMIDTLRLMICQLELANYQCTGIVMHPADWAKIELTKDANGRYIFGDPSVRKQPKMWGVTVIPTPAMSIDTALVGDFEQAALIFDREQNRVDISTEDEDNFKKNMATIRGEERIGLAVLKPAALIKNTNLPAS